MRSILLDELLTPEIEAVTAYLTEKAESSGIEGLFWISIPPELWNETQRTAPDEGVADDGFRLAVEVGPEWVRFELLVRTGGLLNLGGGPADERQSLFALRWADEMAQKLNLISCTGNIDRP